MKIISLTTDFGIQDGYVGVMKAVIYGIAPDVKIVDISHQVSPQNVLQGGLKVVGHVGYFPEGSIHVIVVDPGVGTARRPIAARIGTQYYVAPDNGVLSPMIEQGRRHSWPMEFVVIDNTRFWLERISNTFHGRDIFSPVAAYLAKGVALNEVGTAIEDPLILPLPSPKITNDGVVGEVISIDHFGNLGTNIRESDLSHLAPISAVNIDVAGQTIDGLISTFGEVRVGSLVALIHSDGLLGISVVNGNAAERLNATPGAKVEVTRP